MIDTSLPVAFADVAKASDVLKGIAIHTPILTSREANERANANVFFKCENLQHVGAFKFRGAYNAISRLDDEQRKKGVVAFSSGNHAQAISLAAQMLGVPAAVVMPSDAPAVKLAGTRKYGPKIIIYDRQNEDREVIAGRLINELGLTLIPPYDHQDVIAGQGTAAKELFEEVGPLDYLFVCLGGGGLISGCALAASVLSPHCRVIGVEPEAGNDAQQSLRKGEIVTIPVPSTIADGARTTHVGKLTFAIMRALVQEIVTVSDDQLLRYGRFFAEQMKIVVEPTGCLAAAAVLERVIDVSGSRVGVIVSGGNIDNEMFCRAMQT